MRTTEPGLSVFLRYLKRSRAREAAAEYSCVAPRHIKVRVTGHINSAKR